MLNLAYEAVAGRAAAASATTFGDVAVARLALTDFRNYRRLRLTLDRGAVVLTGGNGAGKTNLLEALSFLAPGRGLRGARLADIDRRPAPEEPAREHGWAVAATIATRRGSFDIGTCRDGGAAADNPSAKESAEKRIVRIDGATAKSQAALGIRLGVMWLTPTMDRLFLEGSGGRRRFLDRLVLTLEPGHAAHLIAYERALRERSHLLRQGLAAHLPVDPDWLAALEQVMAEEGVAVAAARRELVRRLDPLCAEAEPPFPRARLALAGVVEEWLDEMPALAVEARMAAALAACRREDAQSGGAAIGPHRCDIRVALTCGTAAAFASTGEQKALLISILLAQARLQRRVRGEAPLLLLDEVAAHLDPDRRGALFAMLAEIDGQTWMTGTEAALFAPLRRRAQFLSVCAGVLSPTPFLR
jgi:DNA replication and repair protein RecF